MKLKCIGGEADGRLIHVDEYMRVGDFIRVQLPSKVGSFSFIKDDDVISSSDVVNYRIAVFNFSKDDIFKFLVPENWSDKKAILFQFDLKVRDHLLAEAVKALEHFAKLDGLYPACIGTEERNFARAVLAKLKAAT